MERILYLISSFSSAMAVYKSLKCDLLHWITKNPTFCSAVRIEFSILLRCEGMMDSIGARAVIMFHVILFLLVDGLYESNKEHTVMVRL